MKNRLKLLRVERGVAVGVELARKGLIVRAPVVISTCGTNVTFNQLLSEAEVPCVPRLRARDAMRTTAQHATRPHTQHHKHTTWQLTISWCFLKI